MEAFRERLIEIKKFIDDDQYRKRVLLLCQQTEPRAFEEYSSSGSFRRLEKFESSTYSEVLKAVNLDDNNKPVVMKIMRALTKAVIRKLPSAATRGCQSYNDILNELVVTQALSQLHDGVVLGGQPTSIHMTRFFCFIHEIKVVSGNLERALIKSQGVSSATSNVKTITGARTLSDSTNVYDGEEMTGSGTNQTNATNDDRQKKDVKIDELSGLPEEDRMLMEALPREYVITVMRHDGRPLWWMMTHKKLSPDQLTSVLIQVIIGLAIAENVYSYEHRDLHVSNILIKTIEDPTIPFTIDGRHYDVASFGVKATIIDATFSRLTHNGRIYCRNLTSTLRAYSSRKTPSRMSLQNRSYRSMVRTTKNKWHEFTPKTNLIWLTYLCETLMKNEVMKSNIRLLAEIQKIRDYTLKVKNTLDLLCQFPCDQPMKQQAPIELAAVESNNKPKSEPKPTDQILKTSDQK